MYWYSRYDSFIIKRTLDEYVIGVRRTTWRNILREQGREELSRWVYSAATGPQETEYLQKHWSYWERICPQLISTLSLDD